MDERDPLYQRIRASFDKQGFLKLLGVELEHVEKGSVTLSCRKREDLLQQQGLVHAGVVTTIGDVACGYTALSVMPEDCEVLSVEFKVNMLRPPAQCETQAGSRMSGESLSLPNEVHAKVHDFL